MIRPERSHPIETAAIPEPEVGSRLVGALEELQQRIVGRRRLPDVFIGQYELAQIINEERAARADIGNPEPVWCRVRVGVEGRARGLQ